ncbi:MAG: DUF2304 domain-containing protein [Lachnospiraceae bacterium]|nr:DUF2304 domain-containing protein [Lachnospiraceae bacterium]
MSVCLRVLLVVVSVFATIYAVRKIRQSQMKIENAIYWFSLAIMILILSIFPQIAVGLGSLIGIKSTVNFVYLVMIFLLFSKVFAMSMKNAQLEYKTNVLAEELAIIRNQLEKEKEKNKDKGKEE